jgi:hypothetical protein
LWRDDTHWQAAQHGAHGSDSRARQEVTEFQRIAVQHMQAGKAPFQRSAQLCVAFDHDDLIHRATRFDEGVGDRAGTGPKLEDRAPAGDRCVQCRLGQPPGGPAAARKWPSYGDGVAGPAAQKKQRIGERRRAHHTGHSSGFVDTHCLGAPNQELCRRGDYFYAKGILPVPWSCQ